MNRDSIIYSSFRAFFKGFFLLVGFFVALLLCITFFAALFYSSPSSTALDQMTTVKILPDSHGVRTSSTTLPVLLQINIDGIIGLEKLTMSKIRSQLTESQEGDLKGRVKGLLVRINSPGGTVVDADGIYRAIKQYKEWHSVPIVAYADGLCASGGVYVACAADKIYASERSLIGSVGVIFPSFLNVSQLLDKIGVQSLTIYSGSGKDEMNPLRPWTKNEDAALRLICDYYYRSFVDLVASNRSHLDKEKLVRDYGAHLFPAEEAEKYGFIDGIAKNPGNALELLAAAAGLEGKSYQVVELETETWLSQLVKGESSLLTGKVKHEIGFGHGAIDSELSSKFLYLYQP